MAASDASEKEKENDLFALEVNRASRFHTTLNIFRLARVRVGKFDWTEKNNRSMIETCLAVFAIKQLQ